MEPTTGTNTTRCFGTGNPLYAAYHDEEWGRPFTDTADERGLFERISLEAFLAGLSWLTILRKRDAFRAAFHGFDPARVARFDDADVTRLLQDASLIRNRMKIEATIANAQALLSLHAEGRRLHDIVTAHLPQPRTERPATFDDVPATVPEAKALAKELKMLGFRFLGPVTLYSMWQAVGMVDDHVATCWLVTEGHLPG